MIKQDLIKRIKDNFNLNIYETKVWIALIGKGLASAGEIAEVSGIPRSRTYDVLESLEKQGFAIAKVGKPVKYLAVKPELVIEKLKNNLVEETKERIHSLSNVRETKEYQLLEDIHKTGLAPINKRDIITSIKGRNNIYAHVGDMIQSADNEVIMAIAPEEIKAKARAFSHLFDKLKKSNVKTRIALHGTEDEVKKLMSQFKISAEATDLKSRLFIVDRKQVLLMVTDVHEEGEEIGIWLDSPFFSSALANLFESALRK